MRAESGGDCQKTAASVVSFFANLNQSMRMMHSRLLRTTSRTRCVGIGSGHAGMHMMRSTANATDVCSRTSMLHLFVSLNSKMKMWPCVCLPAHMLANQIAEFPHKTHKIRYTYTMASVSRETVMF